MLTYPTINPVAFHIGPLQVHWYGLMYLLGFIGAWLLALWRVRLYKLDWTKEQVSDLIFYAAMGVILGGRVGYMLFYQPYEFFHQPLSLFKIWQGGMSFHGGLLGVLVAVWLFARKLQRSFWSVTDFLAPLVPLGLAAGRAGNFINGELWGRVSDMPWTMVFPHVDVYSRHPSQLYEMSLEGIGLFIVTWWYAAKPRAPGGVSAVFLIGYGIARLIAEYFREPDSQYGFIAFDWLTMGQLLSLPMVLGGIVLYIYAVRHPRKQRS